MSALCPPREQLVALTDQIRGRLRAVRRRVAAACERSGRDPASVTIVAVTKNHPPEVACAAAASGLTDLAENHVQALLTTMAVVEAQTPTSRGRDHRRPGGRIAPVRWHLVGRLQRNKARHVVGRSILIHAVDRSSLAEELSRRAQRMGVVQRVLLQVNVAGDPAKGGFAPEKALEAIGAVRGLEGLAVEGLTTIPPLPPRNVDAAEAARPYFAWLRQLRDQARATWQEVVHLSMGMSADFEAAVEEGATMVRLGTVLLGPRPAWAETHDLLPDHVEEDR